MVTNTPPYPFHSKYVKTPPQITHKACIQPPEPAPQTGKILSPMVCLGGPQTDLAKFGQNDVPMVTDTPTHPNAPLPTKSRPQITHKGCIKTPQPASKPAKSLSDPQIVITATLSLRLYEAKMVKKSKTKFLAAFQPQWV